MGRQQSGFTIVELVVVIAIVGLLAAAASTFVRPRSYAKTARGFTREISAMCDSARQRAIATRKYQRISVDAAGVTHEQATTTGMAAPTEWETVAVMSLPDRVEIAAFDQTTHALEGEDVPSDGEGLPGTIDFAPDGSATAGSVFIEDASGEHQNRAIVYSATGAVYTYEAW